MTKEFANRWIKSWNSHHLEDILSHYSEDVEITTPMLKLATDINSDSIKGKQNVEAYWKRALEKFSDLHFELKDIAIGVDSIALYYKSVLNKNTIEIMFFDEKGLINRMIAHYS